MSAQSNSSNTVTGLKEDTSKAYEKVSGGAQKLANKADNKASEINPNSQPSLVEQGQKMFNDTSAYVQEQAGKVFGEGKEGSQAAGANGEGTFSQISEQARQYASDALDGVSNMLKKGSENAGEAAKDVTNENHSYVEQARQGASDLLSKAQEQLNSGAQTK